MEEEWSNAGVTLETERRQSLSKESVEVFGAQSTRRNVMLYFF